jgi:predicted transposase/invertase (TIGR01784 family)
MNNKKDPNFIVPFTYDAMFKHVITNDKDYTFTLISKITGISKEELSKAVFNDVRINDNNIKHKHQIADIIISVANLKINLKVNRYRKGIIAKNTSYAINIYSNYLVNGGEYNDDIGVIQIDFNNFDVASDDGIINKYLMMNEHNSKVLTEMLKIYNINLAKIEKIKYTKSVDGELLSFLKLMKAKNVQELENYSKGNPILERVCEDMIKYSKDENLIGVYDKDLQEEMFHNTEMHAAKKEGIEQGKKEDALNMLKETIDIKLISKITGLSIAEIKKLNNK